MRLWYQVTVDFTHHRSFAKNLEEYTNEVASPGTQVTVHGMDRDLNRGLTQTDVLMAPASFNQTIVRLFLRNARKAEKQGYDAFVIGSYAEPALRELRSLVDIPVVSATESTLFTAFSVGYRVALIGLSRQTIPFIEGSVERHKVGQRVSGIYIVNDVMPETELDAKFASPRPYVEEFVRVAGIAVAEGADAIIPAEGMVATIVGRNGITHVDEAPVINGVGVPVMAAENAVRMRQAFGIMQSRKRAYIRPTPAALAAFFDDL